MKIVELVCISVINVRNTIVYTLHTFDMFDVSEFKGILNIKILCSVSKEMTKFSR